MAKVLVTGGSGFIGQHLVRRLLAAGHDVRCLVRSPARGALLRPLGVELAIGDITDRDTLGPAIEGCDVVHQLAGATLAFSPEEYHQVNAGGARNMAEACAKAAHPPVLIYVSSLAAGGPSTLDRPRVESDPVEPVSAYGQSKVAAEVELAQFADRVPISVIRPPIVIGPGDKYFLGIYKTNRWGLHFVPGWAKRRYSIVYVEDLADAMILAAERGKRICSDVARVDSAGKKQGIYYVAHDKQPTYDEMGRMVAQALGHRNTVSIALPSVVCWAVAAGVEAVSWTFHKKLLLNLDKIREAMAGSWTCRCDRAKEEIGFDPPRSLAQRFADTAAGYRMSGWL